MRALINQVLNQFRPSDASEWNVLTLLDCIRVIILRDRFLAGRALSKALQAAKQFTASTLITARFRVKSSIVETSDTRSSLLFQIAGLAAACGSPVLRQHDSDFRPWRNVVSGLTPSEAAKATRPVQQRFSHAEAARWLDDGERNAFLELRSRLAGTSPDSATHLLEQVRDVNIRVPAAIESASRHMTADRTAVALSALRSIPQMTQGINRLRALEDESALLLQAGDDALASECLSLLQRSAATYCRTGSVSPAGEQECEAAYTFLAERASCGEADSIGIRVSADASLRSRVLLRKLDRLVEGR